MRLNTKMMNTAKSIWTTLLSEFWQRSFDKSNTRCDFVEDASINTPSSVQ